jgi:glycosyltransferase involved in cell wall biosynthesis
MHGGDVYYNKDEGYTFPKRWYIKPFLKFTLHHATKLTAITNDCRIHALNAGACDKDIVIITNGADIRRFSRKNNAGVEEIRKKFDLKGSKVIFACRQLIPRKGVRYLIKAMPIILKKYKNVRLIIAGDGMERQFLEELIMKLSLINKVHLVGWVQNDDLPKYYNAADISVMPSLEEGFGIPAVEAMGCELPVVSTDAGGLVEVIDDKINGLIVPKGNEKKLAEAIIKLLDNPKLARDMGKQGRKKAETVFSWDTTAENFIKLFRQYVK